MGYIGNFIAILALIPLPFAGYYLGREVYGANPNMGLLMMGGGFSWTFIIQAILIGILFIGANYYLWMGMQKIAGAERYAGYIKYINAILAICFAVWLTPHNLPLSGEERGLIGEQYHPFSKFFGVMVAKNAAVQLIILSTFFSFLLYRRGNKGAVVPVAKQGAGAKVALVAVLAGIVYYLWSYRSGLVHETFSEKDRGFVSHLTTLLACHIGVLGLGFLLTLAGKGLVGQAVVMLATVFEAVVWLSVGVGFTIMAEANPLLRYVSVVQVLLTMSALVYVMTIDVVYFRGAKTVGGIEWGKMPARSQYVLLTLCVTMVLLMGLMGYIRSGLRENWHVIFVLRDTSATAFTPTMTYMAQVVSVIVFLFLGLITFVFWLASLQEHEKNGNGRAVAAAGH
jgi:hypothetical protein